MYKSVDYMCMKDGLFKLVLVNSCQPIRIIDVVDNFFRQSRQASSFPGSQCHVKYKES